MFIIKYAPYFFSLFDVLRKIKEVLEKREIKREIWELIKEDAEAAMRSYEKINRVLGLSIGLALFLSPQEYSERLDELMREFKSAFNELVERLTKILIVLKDRRETLKRLLSLKEWFYIEPWLSNVSREGINWEGLFETK